MALQKQPIDLSFAQGVDTKTDPFRVGPNNFLTLNNAVFTKIGQLTKRNGYQNLTPLLNDASFLTTFDGGLVTVGDTLQAYSTSSKEWFNKTILKPINISIQSVIKTAASQTQVDFTIAENRLTCVIYSELSQGITTYKYAIFDEALSQSIVAPTDITTIPSFSGSIVGSPRVFTLNKYFVVVLSILESATYKLKYFSISTNDPTIVSAPVNISSQYTPASTVAFDGCVANNNLYLTWADNTNTLIHSAYLTSSFILSLESTFTGNASMVTVSSDPTTENPLIWVSCYDLGTTTAVYFVFDLALNTIVSPQTLFTTGNIVNIASSVALGSMCIFFEVANTYGAGPTTVSTNYIQRVVVNQVAVEVPLSTICRSLGLASKGFTNNDTFYVLGTYSSYNNYQPTYFLIDVNGNTLLKLAYSNGAGLLTTGLPSVSTVNEVASIPYLSRDLIQPVNKNTGGVNAGQGVYTQTGINVVNMSFKSPSITSAEIGKNLNISGGIVWTYDGFQAVEQGFNVWPDFISPSNNSSTYTLTADTTNGSAVLTSVSSITNVFIGMHLTGTNIATDSYVISFTSDTVTLNNAATGSGSTITMTLSGNIDTATPPAPYNYVAVYEWTDNQGNLFRSAPSVPISFSPSSGIVTLVVPTLRFTYKTTPPVKICIYRRSTAQPIFYQIGSLLTPVLNDPTADYVTIQDVQSDAQIVGNAILYTTGGVLENIAPPSTNNIGLFNNRLFLVDAEDENLLWFSKQVIESTPVEMSDLLTIYIAPTTSAQGDTGVITAISPMDDKLILFKKNAIYYINGNGPDSTGANSQYSDAIYITSTVGCINQGSVVMMPNGLMFQSDKGIWLLSRDLSTTYIGAPVESYTQNALVKNALTIPGTNQVRFTMDSGLTLVYDYYFQQWSTFSNIDAISATLYQGLHTYLTAQNQVRQETPGKYLDGSRPVLMNFTTAWFSLAGLQGFERFFQFYLLGTYISPFKLECQISYDFENSSTQSVIVVPDNYTPPWGGESLWGDGLYWGGPGNTFKARVFPNRQKVESFQLTINELYDSAKAQSAAAGLTLSGVKIVAGVKKGYRTQKASQSFG